MQKIILIVSIIGFASCSDDKDQDSPIIIETDVGSDITDMLIDSDTSKTQDMKNHEVCQPSTTTIFEEEKAEGLDAKFDGDTFLVSYVSAAGKIKVVRLSNSSKEENSFVGSEIDREKGISTSIKPNGETIGLAYQAAVAESDPKTTATKTAAVFFQTLTVDLKKNTNPKTLNKLISSSDALSIKHVNARRPQVVVKDGDFLIYWDDHRFNEPKRNGQNFYLDGLYYSLFDPSGNEIQSDKQFIQGGGALSYSQSIAFDEDFTSAVWSGRGRERYYILKSLEFPKPDGETPNELGFSAANSIDGLVINKTSNFFAWTDAWGINLRSSSDTKFDCCTKIIGEINQQFDVKTKVYSVDDTLVGLSKKSGEYILKAWSFSEKLENTGTTATTKILAKRVWISDLRKTGYKLESLVVVDNAEKTPRIEHHISCISKDNIDKMIDVHINGNSEANNPIPTTGVSSFKFSVTEKGIVTNLRVLANYIPGFLDSKVSHDGKKVSLEQSDVNHIEEFNGTEVAGDWSLLVDGTQSRNPGKLKKFILWYTIE